MVLFILLTGTITQQWLACSLLVLGGYIVWLLRQSYLLEKWLHSAAAKPTQGMVGLWQYAAERLQLSKQQDNTTKKHLSRLVQQLHRTLEAMPDGAVVLEENFQVQWYNSAAQRLLGLPTIRSETSTRFEWHERSDKLNQYLQAGDFAKPVEMVSPVHPGLSLEVSVVPFGQGQYLLTAHDISEQKRIQAVRRDFIADVSHELRTPLTVITGYLELLESEDLPEHVQQAIQASARQTERMQRIVFDLLMLSRLEMGDGIEEVVQKLPVRVPELLAGLVEDARRLSGERKHRIELHADPGLQLLGDESQLQSAFGNLIFNAVLHTPAGTGIDVFWRRQSDEALLIVADKGPGIAEEHLARLTERFYRVDKGRSRERGGTGLGLSIVKHVMLRHEARIEIQSALGEGSRFICRFPKARILTES